MRLVGRQRAIGPQLEPFQCQTTLEVRFEHVRMRQVGGRFFSGTVLGIAMRSDGLLSFMENVEEQPISNQRRIHIAL